MPIIPGGTYPVVGMSPATIIDIATRRTGKRGAQTLDINNELLIVIQDLCGQRRWSWRKQTVDLTLRATQQIYSFIDWDYNIGDIAYNLPDIEKLESLQMVLAPDNMATLDEVHSVNEQGRILNSTDTGQPLKFFQRNFYDLVLSPTPDTPNAAFPLRLIYWAIPDTIVDSHGDLLLGVPLVPQFLHRVLVKGLEAQILRYTIGEEDPKYQATQAEYQDQLAKAAQQ
jgi:hypothetical protein